MKRKLITAALALPLFVCIAPVVSAAVASSGTESAATAITFEGRVESSIKLSIKGVANGGRVTTVAETSSGPTVDFGTVDVFRSLSNGERYDVSGPDGGLIGYYLVVTLGVQVTYSGFGKVEALMDIQRANACTSWPDVPCGNLYFARDGFGFGTGIWPAWTGYPETRLGQNVFAVPDSAYVPGNGNLAVGVRSGVPVNHQVAVYVPAETPPGTFRTKVLYTATIR